LHGATVVDGAQNVAPFFRPDAERCEPKLAPNPSIAGFAAESGHLGKIGMSCA
jgi:hypothetical protein